MNIYAPANQFQIQDDVFGAERAIVARCLVSTEALQDAAGKLTVADFNHPFLGQCFDALQGLLSEGRKPSVESLVAQFGNDEIEPRLTVREFLNDLVRGSLYGQFIPLDDAIGAIKDMAQRRALAGIGANLMAGAHGSQSVADLANEAVAKIDDVAASLRQGARCVYDASAITQAAFDHLTSPERTSPTTGLVDLDAMLGGWPKGELSVVAARPAMGKSAVATSALLRAAKARHGCLFFSLEMTAKQIGSRMLTDVAYTRDNPVFYEDVLKRTIDERGTQRLRKAAEFIAALPLVIEVQRGLSITDIASRSRKQAAKYERDGGSLDVVFVDHMLLVKPSQRYAGNRVREVAEISDGLATLAKELNCAVVALCQLNRSVEGRDSKRPGLSDLRDSGAIEEDASTVTFIYRPAYYLEQTKYDNAESESKRQAAVEAQKHTLEFVVAKNRNGRVGIVEAFVEIGANAVRNKSYEGR